MHLYSPSPPLAGERGGDRWCHGFTYIGLLIFIALMGIALAGTGMVWHTQVRRDKERELLFVGDQFRRAISQYYERSPGGDKRFPQSLDDLLLDKRYPATQRYLRRVYPDPITGKAVWGFVKGPEGRIVGVYSLSEDAPFKRASFPANYEAFEGKEHYREWRFVYAPPTPPQQAQQQSQQPQPGQLQQAQPGQLQQPTGAANEGRPETKVIVPMQNQQSN
jgi:type II secretory pathway pseudopilin PulG